MRTIVGSRRRETEVEEAEEEGSCGKAVHMITSASDPRSHPVAVNLHPDELWQGQET